MILRFSTIRIETKKKSNPNNTVTLKATEVDGKSLKEVAFTPYKLRRRAAKP